MNLALVYDRINKFGGAERVLMALHEIWPAAPLYTAVYDKEKSKWGDDFIIKTSFMDKIPFLRERHELHPLVTSWAFESFNFDKFDVVLSITSGDAKCIITRPGTLHFCYCLTPNRYLWSGYREYLTQPGLGLLNPLAKKLIQLFSPSFRRFDYIASARPDVYIAISNTVASRIQTYYRQSAQVIYPPVDTDKFRPQEGFGGNDYFLIVSRLVPYKRIDYVIRSFNSLGWKLKIIGDGLDKNRLKRLAKKNIEFLGGDLTDQKVCWYYQNCKALIFPGEEDFGLVAVEAQACGKPVIGINRGGVTESVILGATGELYNHQTEESLIGTLKKFKRKKYLTSDCCRNAIKYSKQNFQTKIKTLVEKYLKGGMSKL